MTFNSPIMKRLIPLTVAGLMILGGEASHVDAQTYPNSVPARMASHAHAPPQQLAQPQAHQQAYSPDPAGVSWSDTGIFIGEDYNYYQSQPQAAPTPHGNNCGCGGAPQCQSCVGRFVSPRPVYVPPVAQPTGVTSGACAPCISAVDCAQGTTGEGRWTDANRTEFQPLLHGEYIGPVRLPAMLEYRIRVNDEVTFTYIPTRSRATQDYRLMAGDIIQISSISEESLRRERIQVQPDGKVYLPALEEPIVAYGKTIQQLRVELEKAYKKYFNIPAIDVEPAEVNRVLADLLDSVNGPFAPGGRAFPTVVNPDGRIQLPMLGGVYVLGMTLEEIKREVNLRYQAQITGIEVEPRLTQQAPHFFHVYGQVGSPGQFELRGPTTVTAGIAQAGGVSLGGNARQIVIFRRAEDWRLVSTVLDLRGAHLGKRPNPSDEIWLRDSDLIIVPERPITRANQAIQQIFTDGIYRVVPFSIQN